MLNKNKRNRWKKYASILLATAIVCDAAMTGNIQTAYADEVYTENAVTDTESEDMVEESIVNDEIDEEAVEEAIDEDSEAIEEDEIVEDSVQIEFDVIEEDDTDVKVEDDDVSDGEELPISEEDMIRFYENPDELTDDEFEDVLAYILANNEGETDELTPIDDVNVYAEGVEPVDYAAILPAQYPASVDPATGTFDMSEYPNLRNQNPYGTCWAHASIFAVEENLVKHGLADTSVNLSEAALAYFARNSVVDPLNGFKGDYTRMKPGKSWTEGGNSVYGGVVLTDWQGAVSEADNPATAYSEMPNIVANGLDSKYAYKSDKYHVMGTRSVDITNNRDAAKELIMENGMLTISYFAESSDTVPYYNATNNCWYRNDKTTTNHAIAVIGWDDNFSKDKFNACGGKLPAGDGAWLVRNSWTTTNKMGIRGYFWISYYDTSIQNCNAFLAESGDNYDYNYQYDGAIGTVYYHEKNTTLAANVFTAHGDSKGEVIKAAGFTTNTSNVNYTIDVYVNPTDAADPTSGELIPEATVQGTTSYVGYYSTPLGSDVLVGNGDKYAIVVTLKKQGYEPAVALEANINSEIFTTHAAAEAGQSFVWDSESDEWYDVGAENGINVRIKAYADKIPADQAWKVEKHKITYQLNGGKNNAKNPVSHRWIDEEKSLYNATKTGYYFGGWYTNSGLTNRITSIPAHDKKDYTLYAKWIPYKYNVVFYGNGSTSGVTSSMNAIKYGTAYNLRKNGFVRKGYTFKCWNTKKNGTGKSYKNKAQIKNLTSKNGATVKLYAQWTLKKYKITYKLNGGKNNKKNPTSYNVKKTVTFKAPTKTGYTFDGWCSNKALTKKVSKIKKGSTGNKTVYAKWEPNHYYIVLDGNGATRGYNRRFECLYDQTYKLYGFDYKRDGYIFMGWNTRSDGRGTSFAIKEKVKNLATNNGDVVVLYAMWYKIPSGPHFPW